MDPFCHATSERKRGNCLTFYQGRFSLNITKNKTKPPKKPNKVTVRVVRNWNKLPREVVVSPSLKEFKCMWHLGIWFRGDYIGSRLIVDSVTLKVSSNFNDCVVLSILFHACSKVPVTDLISKRTFSSFSLQKFTSLAQV